MVVEHDMASSKQLTRRGKVTVLRRLGAGRRRPRHVQADRGSSRSISAAEDACMNLLRDRTTARDDCFAALPIFQRNPPCSLSR